jgi:glucokinase
MTNRRYLGLDLGGTNIKTAVVEETDSSPDPAVIMTASHETFADRGPQFVTERLIEAGREAIDEFGPISGAGLGVPGLFEPDSGRIVLFPNLPGPWRGHSLRDPVGSALGVPTELINDARAFLLAEGTLGAGKGHNPVVGLTLGTGIGGGVMLDGRIQLGAFGTAGEIGHQIIVQDGPPCGCGSRGCVEALARSDRLAELAGLPDVATVYERAAQGDEECLTAIGIVAEYIGIGIANAITVLGPSCVVIGGGIAKAGDLILDPIRRSVRDHVFLAPEDGAEIVKAGLGDWAGAIGAALAGRGQVDVRAR